MDDRLPDHWSHIAHLRTQYEQSFKTENLKIRRQRKFFSKHNMHTIFWLKILTFSQGNSTKFYKNLNSYIIDESNHKM